MAKGRPTRNKPSTDKVSVQRLLLLQATQAGYQGTLHVMWLLGQKQRG